MGRIKGGIQLSTRPINRRSFALLFFRCSFICTFRLLSHFLCQCLALLCFSVSTGTVACINQHDFLLLIHQDYEIPRNGEVQHGDMQIYSRRCIVANHNCCFFAAWCCSRYPPTHSHTNRENENREESITNPRVMPRFLCGLSEWWWFSKRGIREKRLHKI